MQERFLTQQGNMQPGIRKKLLENKPRIIAVGGGKGGVGKSVVASMLGICLASMNKKTVLLDADFSGANLHGYLGTINLNKTLHQYFQRKTYDLNEIVQQTFFRNLFLVAGTPGLPGAAHFKYWEKQKLLRSIHKIHADYVILDLGAGNDYNTADLFLDADDGIIVANNDTLSIHDAYGFTRVALLRKLQRTFRNWPEIMDLLEQVGHIGNGSVVQPMKDILRQMSRFPNTLKLLIGKQIDAFRPKVVLNAVEETDSRHEVQALRLAAKDLLNVHLDYWGQIRFDKNIRTAIRNLRPDLFLSADGNASEDIVRMVNTNIIARELKAENPESNGWAKLDTYSHIQNTEHHVPICSFRCIAWNCCAKRNGGAACTALSPVPIRKAASF